MNLSDMTKSLVFEGAAEFHTIVSSLNLSKPGAVENYLELKCQ